MIVLGGRKRPVPPQKILPLPDVAIFHAGTRREAGGLVTAGGRVLNVCALGADVAAARARAYEAVARIRFEGMHFRRDIAARGET